MEKKQDCVSMCDRVWICIIFNKILRLRQCPQYTLNNLLLNFIEHMKKWGGQLDIRPPHSKNWGGHVPPSPPGLTPLVNTNNPDWKIGQWCPRFFSRYQFLHPWNRQFFMGENFRAPECPCVFHLSRSACLHSARLYHGRHNNWIK